MRPVFLAAALLLSACASTAPAPSPPPVVQPDQLLEDVRILSADDMEGRRVDTPGSARARAYLVQRLEAIGVEPARGDSYEQPFVFTYEGEPYSGVNLLGRIDGASRSRKTLVVMAHYDHIGMIDGQIYNGADDNASGVAALLSIAQAFTAKPPRHDVLLALVDAEEGGMRGSRVLVSDPPVPLSDVALVVNFDMLSRSDKNELYVAGAAHFPWLQPRLEALAAGAAVTLKLGHDTPAWGEDQDWTVESDHAAFQEKGVPWVYFGVEDHPDYHKPSDDFAAIPQDFYRRSAQTVLDAVSVLDRDLEEIAREGGR